MSVEYRDIVKSASCARALTKLGIWDEVSDRVVTGDQVVEPKPAPEIFVEAAARLEVSPTACLVIEDSTHGCVAGKARGSDRLGGTRGWRAYRGALWGGGLHPSAA